MADQGQASGPNTGVNTGARVEAKYLVRTQEHVSVNRTDLEDIQDFDGTAQRFTGVGIFLLGGASWLGIEHVFDALNSESGFSFSPLMLFCIAMIIVGGFLWHQGGKMAGKKSSRIQRIFDETEEVPPNASTKPETGARQRSSGPVHQQP